MPMSLGARAINTVPLLVFLEVEGAGAGGVALVLGGDYAVGYWVDVVRAAVFPIQGIFGVVTVAS